MVDPPDPRARAREEARSHLARSGHAAVAALFWLIALGLFVLPFLRAKAAPDWDAPDRTRKVALTPEEEELEDVRLDVPFATDVAEFDQAAVEEEWDLAGSLADAIAGASEEAFGDGAAFLETSGLFETERLAPGEKAYFAQCAGCHGLEGDGSGPAATYLDPRPRNLRKGLFKFKSTESGSRPLRADLFRTVTRGLAGSAMPTFRLLSEERRWDIVEYVRYLAIRGEFEQLMLDVAWEDEELPDAAEILEIVQDRWDPKDLRAVFPTVAETPRDPASVERGRALFLDRSTAVCFTCHGEGGRGDGPSAEEFKDGWGYPIQPRDLTLGVFRAGDEGRDLWLTIANGIGGTPMPSFLGALTGEQIWDLVHFVQFLASGSASKEGE